MKKFHYTTPGILNRMKRIMNNMQTVVIAPLDHGVSVGAIHGITNMSKTVDDMANGGADAVVLHKGCVSYGSRDNVENDIGLLLHLSASTCMNPNANKKILACTVQEAIKLGADGVSFHINFGCDDEGYMLEMLCRISGEAREWGMPLLVMAYPRGEAIEKSLRNKKGKKFSAAKCQEIMATHIAHAARVVFELGASIIKIPYTGDIDSFRDIVNSCPVPIVIAGGPKMDTDKEILEMVYDAIQAGAAGTSIGRNMFQHKNPKLMTEAIAKIVHNNASVEEALKIIEE